MPYFCATLVSRSAIIGYGISTPSFSLMFCSHAIWLWIESMERPSSFVPRRVNSSARRANSDSSVVHTGVKSAG